MRKFGDTQVHSTPYERAKGLRPIYHVSSFAIQIYKDKRSNYDHVARALILEGWLELQYLEISCLFLIFWKRKGKKKRCLLKYTTWGSLVLRTRGANNVKLCLKVLYLLSKAIFWTLIKNYKINLTPTWGFQIWLKNSYKGDQREIAVKEWSNINKSVSGSSNPVKWRKCYHLYPFYIMVLHRDNFCMISVSSLNKLL